MMTYTHVQLVPPSLPQENMVFFIKLYSNVFICKTACDYSHLQMYMYFDISCFLFPYAVFNLKELLIIVVEIKFELLY